MASESSVPLPLALVDEDYWVYLALYRGESGPHENAKDMFCLVLQGAMEVRGGEETLSLEQGEAFLAKGGVSWSVSAEGSGAAVLQFERRSQESRGEGEGEGLTVM